ncbi:hypothetical protein [Limosilactobacillus oris]|uniref:hypothetical protein n=1 Tax=Limosilactobacillus oris TaxID=1632 RepID=UPI001883845A|nr:hypothetical protein [Limosilactobacillus oris]MBF0600876.1 hypothetical protein [Limosilactobacillus oris]
MTTINEALNPLGDGFRKLYGTGVKYTAADMAKLLSGLEVHNLLDSGQFYDSKVDNSNNYAAKTLTGIDVDKWNKYLLGKKVRMSFDAEWSGFVKDDSRQNRFGLEFQLVDEDGLKYYPGAWLYPDAQSGKQTFADEMTISSKPIKKIGYAYMFNHVNDDAIVKITNVKVYVDPLGG